MSIRPSWPRPDSRSRTARTARVEDYYPPEVNDDGDLACGFDVVLDNGTHLEFSIKNTGWGKSFAAAHAPKKPGRGRTALILAVPAIKLPRNCFLPSVCRPWRPGDRSPTDRAGPAAAIIAAATEAEFLPPGRNKRRCR